MIHYSKLHISTMALYACPAPLVIAAIRVIGDDLEMCEAHEGPAHIIRFDTEAVCPEP